LFGIVHSAQADGSMYLPWKIAQPGRQIPYQYAMAYLVLAGLFFMFSFHKESRALPDISDDADHGQDMAADPRTIGSRLV
jgi:hypothetical protein